VRPEHSDRDCTGRWRVAETAEGKTYWICKPCGAVHYELMENYPYIAHEEDMADMLEQLTQEGKHLLEED
jgi:hypothetical protein